LDTRNKILPLEAAREVLSSGDWVAAVGLFDPLTAVQARRLSGLTGGTRKLLAVVLRQDNTLLAAEARAALVAGLREVAAVVIVDPDEWRGAIPESPRVEVVEDTEGERARSAEFVQFVLNRQNG
jgi:hypothetical protein